MAFAATYPPKAYSFRALMFRHNQGHCVTQQQR